MQKTYELKKQQRLGETRTMSNGLKATVANYKTAKHIDIQFENGQMCYDKDYSAFIVGKISCPLICTIVNDYVECMNVNIVPNVKFLIDLEDVDKVENRLWHLDKDGYIQCSGKKIGKFKLHRYLMNCPKNMQIDHINTLKFDNRKCNLRICTTLENSHNRSLQKSNTSGYKGIFFRNDCNKWYARIYYNYKQVHLGYFDDKIEAAKAYNEAAIKYHGEFARLNVIE